MTLAVAPIEHRSMTGPAPAAPTSLPVERRLYTGAAAMLAVLLCIGIFRGYFVPAHPGTDQNGYLVGGKNFARTLTMRFAPQTPGGAKFDPHQFVGRMWIGAGFGTEQERYYPKYPLGYPLLIAIALWLGGAGRGVLFAYSINPIATGLTVLATFLLLRRFVSAFWAFCGTVVCLSSPMILGLATNPNSHATGTCCDVWGIYLLLRWWQRGGVGRAGAAGFLLGYAATIRYSEATLILPIVLVAIFNWRRWRQSWAVLLGWAVPVGVLVSYNVAAIGHVTGYDGTHESSGFSFAYAAENWDALLKQLGGIGLYGLFPLSIAGLIGLLWRQWRLGLVVVGWIVPTLVAYLSYYWAPDPLQQNGAYLPYLRFFATITPGLVLAAMWVLDQLCRLAPQAVVRAGCGTIVLLSVALQLQLTCDSLEADAETRRVIQDNAGHVLADVPAGAVVFAPENSQINLMQHLQFVGDYIFYGSETFNKGFIDGVNNENPDDPQTWDPSIRASLHERLGKFSQQQLDEQARQIISMSIRSGRRVFFLLSRRDNDPQIRRKRMTADPAKLQFGGEAGGYLKRFAPDSMYDATVADAWSTVMATVSLNSPGRGMTRHDRPNRPGESRWQLVEITQKPPTPPTTAPKSK